MATGRIKMINRDKGFGFIKDDTGHEWFFHKSESRNWDRLKEEQRVEFIESSGPKGPRAKQVDMV